MLFDMGNEEKLVRKPQLNNRERKRLSITIEEKKKKVSCLEEI